MDRRRRRRAAHTSHKRNADLHTFSPRELGELIPDYITECLQRGICELRIIHGRDRACYAAPSTPAWRDPRVVAFQLADESGGGWGATLVRRGLSPRTALRPYFAS